MIICVNCKHEFQELNNIDSDEKTSCPICGGSLSPLFTLYTSGNITPSGRFIGQKDAIDGSEAIRVADSQSRSSSADLNTDGTLSYTIEGPSPTGESDTPDACRTLIECLNKLGGYWEEGRPPEGHVSDVDWITSDGVHNLQIQVIRVMNTSVWKSLGTTGSVTSTETIETVVEDIRRTIRHKEKIPPKQRTEILLALNAMDAPGHTFDSIVKYFRSRYGQEIQRLGFQAIWIVGPLASLTKRLDVKEVLS